MPLLVDHTALQSGFNYMQCNYLGSTNTLQVSVSITIFQSHIIKQVNCWLQPII